MANDDRRISERVRRVLTSHWIDLSELRFTCTRGTLRFHGILRRLASEGHALTIHAPLIEVITQEIRRLRGVGRVYFAGVIVEDSQNSGPAPEASKKLILIENEEEGEEEGEPEISLG